MLMFTGHMIKIKNIYKTDNYIWSAEDRPLGHRGKAYPVIVKWVPLIS